MPKSNQILSNKDVAAIQQPLDKTGYTNPTFDKLYGHKTKNPWHGTERDIKNRKAMVTITEPVFIPCPKCGRKMFEFQQVCCDCREK